MRAPTLLLLAALGVGVAAPLAARAQGAADAPPGAGAPEDVRARALALLGGIDRPVSADAFRALGPGGDAALEEIARSGELPVYRVRALEALALVRSPRAEPVHRDLAADRSAPRVVRSAAVRGLGRLAGPAAAPRELRAFLVGDPDPAIRAAAAESLAAVAPRRSCGEIRARLLAEPPANRAGFRRALAACERR